MLKIFCPIVLIQLKRQFRNKKDNKDYWVCIIIHKLPHHRGAISILNIQQLREQERERERRNGGRKTYVEKDPFTKKYREEKKLKNTGSLMRKRNRDRKDRDRKKKKK